MADFTPIDAEIDEKIVPNNNAQLVTAKKLNDLLHDMMSAVNDEKQDTLVAGEGITIDGNVISTDGGSSVDVIDTLTSDRSDAALSAKQGKVLDGKKVDKETGKGLSSNDYTDTDKGKVASALQPSALTPYRTASEQDAIDDAIEERLDDVEEVIPSQASSSNQLADKNFVNSSVQTASANFRGNWATKSAIPTDYTQYPADYAGNKKPTTNDYLIVQADESQDGGTWRYKYSGDWDTDGVSGWFAEYQVNETPLTSAQLAALNSGITSGKVTQYDGYATSKQDKINDLASIREGASAGATAVQPSALGAYRTSSEQDIIDAGKEDKNYIDEDTSTTAVSEALVVGKTYKYMPSAGVATLAFTLTAPTASDEVKFWRFKFKSGATATEFTPPANLYWAGGESLIPEANTIYEIMIDEDYCVSVLAFKQASA